MKTKKLRNKIVYVIPPQCVKLLKHKSATPKCHSVEELSEPSPFSILSNIVNPNETGITDWLFKPRRTTLKQEFVDETTYTIENTTIPAEVQETKQTATSLTLKNTLPNTTATSKPSTSTSTRPLTVTTDPIFTYKPSITGTTKTLTPITATQETKQIFASSTSRNTLPSTTASSKTGTSAIPPPLTVITQLISTETKTATPITATSKSTSVTSPWPIITEPVSTVYETLTKSKTVSPLTTTSRSTVETSPKPIVTQPLSLTSTEKPKTLTPASTVPTSSPLTITKAKFIRETSKKCYEWYNKIKSISPSQRSSTTPIPQTSKSTVQPTAGKCFKWYDLIKDLERNPCYKKSVCWEKKPHIECKTSMLSRIDRWLDQRTGMEYVEPIFSSTDTKSEDNLGNPFTQLLANRQPDMPTKNVFDHAIEDRLETLKWLNQQINNQYRILTKIEKNRRTNRSVGSVSKVRIFNPKVRVNGASRSNRAQRFRDDFIKMKMQRLSIDKNDGWWKNFNAKMYDRKENEIVVEFSV